MLAIGSRSVRCTVRSFRFCLVTKLNDLLPTFKIPNKLLEKLSFSDKIALWLNKLEQVLSLEGIPSQKQEHLNYLYQVVSSLSPETADASISECLQTMRGVFSDEELTLIGVAFNDLKAYHFLGDTLAARNAAIEMVGFVANPYADYIKNKSNERQGATEGTNYCECRWGFYCTETCGTTANCRSTQGLCGFMGLQNCIGDCQGDPNPN